MKIENEATEEIGEVKVCPICGAENYFTAEELRSYETEYYCAVCSWELRRCP